MTAIAGLVDNGRVYLGGDSAGVAGLSLTVRADAKVFRNGPYVMGFTTSFRMGQLLRHAFKPPAPTADLPEFMCTTWVDAVRECLKAGGYAYKQNEQEFAGNFLVGVGGRLFEIGRDYQVGEPADGYAAVGCAYELVLGSLYSTVGQPPKRRLRTALEAAEHFSGGVCAPFSYVSAKGLR